MGLSKEKRGRLFSLIIVLMVIILNYQILQNSSLNNQLTEYHSSNNVLSNKDNQNNLLSITKQSEKEKNHLETNTVIYYCYDLFVSGNVVYTTGGFGLKIRNASNPANPEMMNPYILSVNYSVQPYVLSGNGNFTYIGLRSYHLNTNGVLGVINSKENATYIQIVQEWSYDIEKIRYQSNYLFVLCKNASKYFMSVLNVTEPQNPISVCNYTVNNVQNFFVEGNFIYLITEDYGLQILNITDSFNLNLVKGYQNNNFKCLFFSDNFMFSINEFGLEIYENSDPMNLEKVAEYNQDSLKSGCISNHYAYLVTDRELIVLNIENIGGIRKIDEYRMLKRVNLEFKTIIVKKNLAYIMTEYYLTAPFSTYENDLYIFRIKNSGKTVRVYPSRIPLSFKTAIALILFGAFCVPQIFIIGIIIIVSMGKRLYKKSSVKEHSEREEPSN